MIETFVIEIPNSINFPYLKIIIVSLLLSILIVFPTMGFRSINSILCVLLLSVLFYILISTMTDENAANEMPSTLYPSQPRLGLDGISLNNYYTGSSLDNINNLSSNMI